MSFLVPDVIVGLVAENGGVASASAVGLVAETAGENRLLRSLPVAERHSVSARAELVELRSDEVLASEAPAGYVYFPVDCVVAVGLVEGLAGIDLVAVGREGLIGLAAFTGFGSDRHWAVCRIGGRCLRLPAALLPTSLADWPHLEMRARRYGQAMTTIVLQRVLCGRRHARDARCASWLLQTGDRVPGSSFPMTHGVLAGMLGVRRATVSESAADLQRAGLIQYSRGRMLIVDRKGLEGLACPCYPAMRRLFDAVTA